MAPTASTLSSKRRVGWRPRRMQHIVAASASTGGGSALSASAKQTTGRSCTLWTDFRGQPDANARAFVGENPRVWEVRKAAVASERRAITAKHAAAAAAAAAGESDDAMEEEVDELEDDEAQRKLGDPDKRNRYEPVVFVQAMRTGNSAKGVMAWEYLAKWSSWELCAISDWTDAKKFGPGCKGLEKEFWEHIKTREKKSKKALAKKLRKGEKVTVERRWYEAQVEADNEARGGVADTRAAKQPFVWPLRLSMRGGQWVSV